VRRPKLAPAAAVITIRDPGASPAALEQDAGTVEAGLMGLRELQSLRTTVEGGRAVIEAELLASADPVAVQQALMSVRQDLLEGAWPTLAFHAPDERTWLVEIAGGTPSERASAWDAVRVSLLQTPGVREAEGCGLGEEGVVVRLDPARAAAHGVSAALARALGGAASVEDLRGIRVREDVRVEDLATVERSAAPSACRAFHGSDEVWVGEVRATGPIDVAGLAPPSLTVTARPEAPRIEVRGAMEVGAAVARAAPGAVVLARDPGRIEVVGDADPAAIGRVTGAWDPAKSRIVRLTGPDRVVLARLRDQLGRRCRERTRSRRSGRAWT
jgi:hypothetical protein